MASSAPHYIWAFGHFVLLAASLRYLIGWLTFHASTLTIWYKTAFVGAIVSYAIVVYKSLGVPTPTSSYFKKAVADENFQYFALAVFWLFTKPVALVLVPYATFSLFHALTFTRANIIPRIFPPPPVTGTVQPERTPQHPVSKTIQAWVKANYDSAMRSVAWTELAIMARVILGAIFGVIPFLSSRVGFKNSLLTPLIFAHFLRLRYYYSPFTRQVMARVNVLVSAYVDGPEAHPLLKPTWNRLKGLLEGWGASSIQPQPATPQAAPANQARR